jgi:hypothetical protein
MGLDFKDCEKTGVTLTGITPGSITQETRSLNLLVKCINTGTKTAQIVYVSKGHKDNIMCLDALYDMNTVSEDMFQDHPDRCETKVRIVQIAKTTVTRIPNKCRVTQKLDNEGNITCLCHRRKDRARLAQKKGQRDYIVTEMEKKYGKVPIFWTKENIKKKLKNHLLKEFHGTAFNLCETQELQIMTVSNMKVEIKEGAKPVNTTKAYPVPLHLRNEAKR